MALSLECGVRELKEHLKLLLFMMNKPLQDILFCNRVNVRVTIVTLFPVTYYISITIHAEMFYSSFKRNRCDVSFRAPNMLANVTNNIASAFFVFRLHVCLQVIHKIQIKLCCPIQCEYCSLLVQY